MSTRQAIDARTSPRSVRADDQRTRDIRDYRGRTGRNRGWLLRRTLAGADALGLVAAFALAEILFGADIGHNAGRFGALAEVGLFLLTLPGWIVLAKIYGLYDRDEERTGHSTADEIFVVLNMVTVGAWSFFALSLATQLARPSVPKLIAFWALAILLVSFGRSLARAACRRTLTYYQNTIIVGAGSAGRLLAQKLLAHPEYGANPIGFVDEYSFPADGSGSLPILGTVPELPRLVRDFRVDRVVVAYSQALPATVLDVIRSLNTGGVQVDILPRYYEILNLSSSLHSIEGIPLVGVPPARLPRSSIFLKRSMDVALSAIGLVLLTPLFASIAIAIKLDSPGSVFFRQLRIGKSGRTFRILKFRTMIADADEHKHEVAHLNKHLATGDPRMFKVPNDPRITAVGRLLRRYSLDELPQLLNVLRGEMSLVGPRPLILDEAQHVSGWAERRTDLKPGITGLWQVLGRDDIRFDEMVELDYQYVAGWSLADDLKLMLQTIPVLLRERNAC
jgi:exopolysaccharide biosynthesis polyprenyl glycosylphosphotransferase